MARRRDEWGVESARPPKANGNGYVPTAPLLREQETPRIKPVTAPSQTAKPAGQTSEWGDSDAVQPKLESAVTPDSIERGKGGRNAFDVHVRENYARRHPETTGGEWGAQMRAVNGQMVDLTKRMGELDEEITKKEQSLDLSRFLDPGRLPHSITQAMDVERKKLDKLKEQKKGLQEDEARLRWGKTYLDYEALRMRPDFREKSAYRFNRGETRRESRWLGTELRDTGYVDVDYDSINGDELAKTLSWDWPGKHYEAASKDVAEIFNYLYETQGRDAAYAYMDHMGAGEYSGADILAMGIGKGLGLNAVTDAVTAGGAKLFGLDEADGTPVRPMGEIEDEMLRQDPELFSAGNVAGSVMLAGGLAKATSAIPAVTKLSPAGQAAVTGSAAWGGSTAIHELGDAASGELGWGEYGKDALVGMAAGGVGGAASAGVQALGTKALFKMGLQNSRLANAAVDALGGVGFDVGSTGTRALLDDEYRPDGGELFTDLAIGFGFDLLASLADTAATSRAAKAQMDGDITAAKLDMADILGGGSQGVAALDDLAERSASLRNTLDTTQYVGYDRDVTRARTFLDWMDDALDTTRRTYRSSSAYGFSPETQRELERLAAEMYHLEGTDWDVPADRGSWTWGPGAQEVTVPDPALSLKETLSAKVLAKRYEIEYTDSPRYQLLETYVRSVEEGRMSSKIEFPVYEAYHDQIQERLVGRVIDGVEITGQSNHFLERVFGCEEAPLTGLPRDGVELADLFDCLENPVEIGPIKIDRKGRPSFVIKGRNAQISINPDTGLLIQTNAIRWR